MNSNEYKTNANVFGVEVLQKEVDYNEKETKNNKQIQKARNVGLVDRCSEN